MEILAPTIQARGTIAEDPYLRPADATRAAYASLRILHTPRRRDPNGQWQDAPTEAAELKATGRTAELIAHLATTGQLAKGAKITATGRLGDPDAYITKDGTAATTPILWIDRIGIDLLRQTAADQAKARRQQTTATTPTTTWAADTYQAPTQNGWPAA